jgi:hypothetical protein
MVTLSKEYVSLVRPRFQLTLIITTPNPTIHHPRFFFAFVALHARATS